MDNPPQVMLYDGWEFIPITYDKQEGAAVLAEPVAADEGDYELSLALAEN